MSELKARVLICLVILLGFSIIVSILFYLDRQAHIENKEHFGQHLKSVRLHQV